MERRKKQVRITTDSAQVEALARVSQQRGISKAALVREGLEAVTGIRSSIVAYPPGGQRGFSNPQHPAFRGKREGAEQ